MLGVISGGWGAYLKGRAGAITKNELLEIARTKGVDTSKITAEALAEAVQNMEPAIKVSGMVSRANQEQLLAREEMALPGAGAARAKNLDAINALFDDDKKWLAGVQRRGAALGLEKGLFGGAAGQVATLRLSDQEKAQRTSLGSGLLGGLLSTLRIAQTPGLQTFLGPNAIQLTEIRSGERTQAMNIKLKAAGVPGMTAAMGSWLSSMGGALFSAGAGGLTGGMGGGMGGGGGGPQSWSNGMPYGGEDYAGGSGEGTGWNFGGLFGRGSGGMYLGRQPGKG